MTDPFPSDPLAKVRNHDGTVDWLAVGEAEQARRCNRATGAMIGVLDWLHANGGTYNVAQAAHRFAGHLTHVRHYRAPKTALAPTRARSCSRSARPRERRSSASSTTSSADPGADSDEPAPAPVAAALGVAHRVASSWLAAASMLVEREEGER